MEVLGDGTRRCEARLANRQVSHAGREKEAEQKQWVETRDRRKLG